MMVYQFVIVYIHCLLRKEKDYAYMRLIDGESPSNKNESRVQMLALFKKYYADNTILFEFL